MTRAFFCHLCPLPDWLVTHAAMIAPPAMLLLKHGCDTYALARSGKIWGCSPMRCARRPQCFAHTSAHHSPRSGSSGCTSTIRRDELLSRADVVQIRRNWRWLALLASTGRDVPTRKRVEGPCGTIQPSCSRSPATARDCVNRRRRLRDVCG